MLRKKSIALLCILVFVFLSAVSYSALASAPTGSNGWGGSIDFWESRVGDNTVKRYSGKAYRSLLKTGDNDSFYVYLTIKDTSNTIYVKKTKFAKGDEMYSDYIYSDVDGYTYRLTGAREYIWDIRTYCSGNWRP